MDSASPKKEGRRERKRLETLRRIAETGLKLFIAHGYEGTTLKPSRRRQAFRAGGFSTISSRKKRGCWRCKGGAFARPSRPPAVNKLPTRRPSPLCTSVSSHPYNA